MVKNTKQSKQKKSVLNKLGGLSKRSKFIVVVLIFAVLGGGYLTYKSFAATVGPASILTRGANLRFYDWQNGCTSNKVNDGSKNAVVMNVSCPPSRFWSAGSSSGTQSVRWPQGTYINCVMAKGFGSFGVTQGGSTDWNGYGAKYYTINDSNYKEYCSYAVAIGSAGITFRQNDGGDLISGRKAQSTLLTFSSMTKRWYAPGVAPAPSGK